MLSDNVKKPGAWLKSAIEDGWRNQEPRPRETAIETTNEFLEWFELALAQGVVRAKAETEEGLMIQESAGRWIAWESFVERGWTLEYLKSKAKPR